MHKFGQVMQYTPEESFDIARIRVARYLSKFPSEVDAMPYDDFSQVLEVMRGESLIGAMT